jgi:hypothetical protein
MSKCPFDFIHTRYRMELIKINPICFQVLKAALKLNASAFRSTLTCLARKKHAIPSTYQCITKSFLSFLIHTVTGCDIGVIDSSIQCFIKQPA